MTVLGIHSVCGWRLEVIRIVRYIKLLWWQNKHFSILHRFLQGCCTATGCTLSHDVGPEKMPTCKYFLEGCCVRDNCPYVHVKVNAKAGICKNFLRGYCPDGQKVRFFKNMFVSIFCIWKVNFIMKQLIFLKCSCSMVDCHLTVICRT